jgi:ribosomal protein L37E
MTSSQHYKPRLKSSIACEQCGEAIKLRSFRVPPRRCPQCGGLRDPAEARENFGCLILFPVAISAAVLCGLAGMFVGHLLAPIVNIPQLHSRLALIAGSDGFGIVCFVNLRVFGRSSDQNRNHPALMFLSFVSVAMIWSLSLNTGWLVFTCIANGVVATGITWTIFRFVRRPTEGPIKFVKDRH